MALVNEQRLFAATRRLVEAKDLPAADKPCWTQTAVSDGGALLGSVRLEACSNQAVGRVGASAECGHVGAARWPRRRGGCEWVRPGGVGVNWPARAQVPPGACRRMACSIPMDARADQGGPLHPDVGAAARTAIVLERSHSTRHRPVRQWGQRSISTPATRRMKAWASCVAFGLAAGMRS